MKTLQLIKIFFLNIKYLTNKLYDELLRLYNEDLLAKELRKKSYILDSKPTEENMKKYENWIIK